LIIWKFLIFTKFELGSEFIDEVFKWWNTWSKSLSLSNGFTVDVGFRSFFKWITTHLLPMGEDTLWESSTGGSLSKSGSETE
jgi:hypothetical protein